MEMLKKIWNVVSTVLVALMVLCAVFLLGSRMIGYECYNVISPSMTPVYDVGDLIYVKEVDPYTIQPGDVITFIVNEDLVIGTHRVVRVDTEKKCFYTKGDANEIEDAEPVHFNNVIGVPQFSIPKLGYVSDFVQNPPGMYITVAVGIVLIFLVFAVAMILELVTKRFGLTKFEHWCLVAILGGGLGNMIDRIRLGYVVDMIRLEFMDFPIFNVADCFITCGCIALIVHLMFFNKRF